MASNSTRKEEQKIKNDSLNQISKDELRNELIVYGYIKSIEILITTIIPTSLIKLCHKFNFIDIEPHKLIPINKPKKNLYYDWYKRISKIINEKNYLLAIKLGKYYIKNINSGNYNQRKHLFHNLLAITYESIKLPYLSEIHYKKAILGNDCDSYSWNYSELLNQQSRFIERQKYLKKAIKLAPNRLLLHFSLAQCLEDLNQISLSQKEYLNITIQKDISKDNGKNALFKAVAYKKIGYLDKSKREYLEYTKLIDKDNVSGNTRYAILLYILEKYDESLDFLDRAIEIQQDTAFTYYYYGLIMQQKQQFLDSKIAFEQALDICPYYKKCQAALLKVKRICNQLQL